MDLPPELFDELLASIRNPLLDPRAHPRLTFRATAYANLTGEDAAINVAVHDLSRGGMGITIAAPVAVGQTFIVSMQRPRPAEPLLLVCEVRHAEPLGNGVHRVGLRFLDNSDAGPLARPTCE